MELAFASLHQLCAPMLDRLERLPAPQRQALEIVFGLSAGAAPDRFLVGLAVLSLLSEVDEERPLLCVVDDAQWLDHASALTLAFVARRLLAEPVGIVFAAREPGEELQHLPELEVHGLARRRRTGAVGLGGAVHAGRASPRPDNRGDPRQPTRVARAAARAERDGAGRWVRGARGAGALRGGSRRATFADSRRSPRTRGCCCCVAAAEPIGDPLLLLRASERSRDRGLGVETATDGLLALGERVTFRHPLVRSAVYRSAGAPERRAAHLALAEATDRDARSGSSCVASGRGGGGS